jgi:hypothetical protein
MRFIACVPAVGSVVTMVELSTGTPSTTKMGCDVPSIDFCPRIMMKLDAPGSPDDDVTTTPGAFAASACTVFNSFDLTISSLFTVLTTAPSRSIELAVPAPVTTTSPRRSGLTVSVKLAVTVPAESVTCWVAAW